MRVFQAYYLSNIHVAYKPGLIAFDVFTLRTRVITHFYPGNTYYYYRYYLKCLLREYLGWQICKL
jgi:hypothetical protein